MNWSFCFIVSMLNFLVIYAIYEILNLNFEMKYKVSTARLIYIAFYFVSTVLVIARVNHFIVFIIYVGMVFITAGIYKTSIQHRIFLSTFIAFLINGSEIVVRAITILIANVTNMDDNSNRLYIMLSHCIATILIFMIVKGYKFKKKKSIDVKKGRQIFTPIGFLGFMIIPILCVISIALLVMLEPYLSRSEISIIVIVMGITLLIGIVYFVVYDIIVDKYREQRENEFLQIQIKYYENQYDQIKSNLKNIRKIKHNIKYELNAILAENEIEEAKERIQELLGSVQDENYLPYTQSKGLDISLNYMKDKAKRNNIDFRINSDIIEEILVPSRQLAVLIGNALDNAIDGSSKSPDKFMEVDITSKNKLLFIMVKNSFDGKIKIKNNMLMTTKEDGENHGFGVSSIKESVKELNGKVKIKVEKDKFILEILIPNEEFNM